MRKFHQFLFSVLLCLIGLSASPAAASTVIGGTTSVTLTAAPTLVGLGLTIGTTGAAKVTGVSSGIPTVAFPITGGTLNDMTSALLLMHDGSGLSFTAGTNSLLIGNFLVDTSTDLITGDATANGKALGSVPLFTIGSGLSLSLTSQAAGAFTTVFGAPDLTGVTVGTASVNPVLAGVPEPATWAMMLIGFALVGFSFRQSRRAALAHA